MRLSIRDISLTGLAILAVACSSKPAPSTGGGEGPTPQGSSPAPSCSDAVQNGAETDIDCGGQACATCAVGKGCFAASDCASGVCTNKTCVAPSCSDGVRNGDETAVDCGGACAPCSTSLLVDGGSDGSATSDASVPSDASTMDDGAVDAADAAAPSCNDGLLNGTETDVDCGGSCGACADGKRCIAGDGCVSGSCKSQTCVAPSCGDGVKNASETDVDCGGGTCAVCPADKACLGPADCASGVCNGGTCAAPRCDDGVKNGDETALDCGGSCQNACAVGSACVSGHDCASGVCVAKICQPASCGDHVKNGDETDRDCGGAKCARCGAGQSCASPSDCASGVCTSGVCNANVVAPALAVSTNATVASATRFLYSGPNAVQTGVAPGTIVETHAAAIRGRVLDRANAPVADVVVTVLDHPELGQTATHADGTFDMVVNGGAPLVLSFKKTGVLPVQRNLATQYGDYASLDDVVVTPLDAKVTAVDLPSMTTPVVAQGTTVTDGDGTRTATAVFMPGTTASMKVGNASTPITSLHVRATEYTVGSKGLQAMPGSLPPSSKYTYAVELSVDEAIAAGASTVTFSQPVPFYVDNFLGMPVGALVPVGYYDHALGRWVPEPNGRVIKVLSVNGGGAADLDVDGSGKAADGAALAALGIAAQELNKIGATYAPGATFWRAPLEHFSGHDLNYGGGAPPGAGPPPGTPPPPKKDDPCERRGSIIGCDDQTLGESLPIPGTPYALRYDSGHAQGRKDDFSFEVPISGATLPPNVLRIDVQVNVAGRAFKQSFPATANQTFKFTWDGLDAFGRKLPGRQRADGSIAFVYKPVYYAARADLVASFAALSADQLATDRTRGEIMIQQTFTRSVGVPATPGLGGWLLSAHHTYSLGDGTIYLGDGTRQRADSLGETITTIAGTGKLGYNGDGIRAVDADLANAHIAQPMRDGSMIIVDYMNHRLRKVSPDGIISTFAGTGTAGHNGNEGLAVNAQINRPHTLAIGSDDSVYFSEPYEHTIRKITPDGVMHAFAGTGTPGFSGDGGPATSAMLNHPYFLDLATDGSLWVADTDNHRVRRVSPEGVITTEIGTGDITDNGVGQPGRQHNIHWSTGIAAGPDGSIYFGDWSCRIRKLGTDGIVRLVVGNGTCGVSGDGGPATAAGISAPMGFGVGRDGTVYFVEYLNDHVIRKVTPDGVVRTIAGTLGIGAFSGDGGPARRAQLYGPNSVKVFPDGSLVFADLYNSRIRRIAPPVPSLTANQYVFPSKSGSELFVFDAEGRHLETRDAMSGVKLVRFGYDAAGRLTTVTDPHNRAMTIQRDAAGQPIALVAPDGQTTTLTVDANGNLSTVKDAAGKPILVSMTADGLLVSMTERNGEEHDFTYDSAGRLVRDDSPGGVSTTLNKTVAATKTTLSATSTLGRATTYSDETVPGGDTRRTVTSPAGATSMMETFQDGGMRRTLDDGTIQSWIFDGDPRFGMQSPMVKSLTTKTPSGLTRTESSLRTSTLATPNDPLSLTSQTTSFTVNNRVTTRAYDVASRTETITRPSGQTTVLSYDAYGLVVQVQADAAVAPTSIQRDSAGRPTSVGSAGETTLLTYGLNGQAATVTAPTGEKTTFSYDTLGRIKTYVTPGNRAVALAYDGPGNLASVTVPAGGIHAFEYVDGRRTKYVAPGGATTLWSYDADAGLSSLTLASGRAMSVTRDVSGRPQLLAAPDFTTLRTYVGATTRTASLTRSPKVGASQQLSIAYDGPLVTRRTFAGPASGQYQFAYDANFWPTSVQLDANSPTTLGYDVDGNETVRGTFTITRGGPAHMTSGISDNAGALSVSIEYDVHGREKTRTVSVAGTAKYTVSTTYDASGRTASKSEDVAGAAHVFEYGYGPDGELVSVKRDGATVESYIYDADGNRTHAQRGAAPAVDATFNAADQVVTRGGVSYAFDVDGFMTGRGSDTFSYAVDGTLLSATVGATTVTYGYDGLGRRVTRTEGGKTTQYLYASNDLRVSHTRDSAGALSEYFYDDVGRLYAVIRGGTRYYVASDAMGTPRLVVDANGTLTMSVDYDAFGNVLSGDPSTFELPVGFGGGIPDAVTGLVRLGARDYEPATGRFTARDPILFAGAQSNLYAYVNSNPTNGVDRQGTLANVGVGGAIALGGLALQLAFDKGSIWYKIGVSGVVVGTTMATAGLAAPFGWAGAGAAIGFTAAGSVEAMRVAKAGEMPRPCPTGGGGSGGGSGGGGGSGPGPDGPPPGPPPPLGPLGLPAGDQSNEPTLGGDTGGGPPVPMSTPTSILGARRG